MKYAVASTFEREYEYDNAKREARKADRARRQARRGKKDVWQGKE